MDLVDDDAVVVDLAARIGRRLLDGLAVEDPLDLGRRIPVGGAVVLGGLVLGAHVVDRLDREVGRRQHIQADRVRLGHADAVARLALVVARVLKVDALDDQRLAVTRVR